MKGTWSQNKSKSEVKEIMQQRAEKGAEKRKLAFQTLKKVEEIKAKWIEDSKKWSKELQETIITNLFQ